MSTLQIALARIAVLEARLDALEAGGASTSSGGGSASGGGPARVEPLSDGMLDKSWADSVISKDPKNWKGRSQVGRKLSMAPVEWLESMAGFHEWCADKGRKEVPVRLQESGKNAGKPWHEADTFKARLLRAWARRAANRPKAPPPKSTDFLEDPGPNDTDFNFGENAKGRVTPPDDDVGF